MSQNKIFIPKRAKWASLTDLRNWLIRDTQEQVVSFNGHELVTTTTKYTMSLGEVCCEPAPRPARAARRQEPQRRAVTAKKKIRSARYADSQ
jgi:hypothetical protein